MLGEENFQRVSQGNWPIHRKTGGLGSGWVVGLGSGWVVVKVGVGWVGYYRTLKWIIHIRKMGTKYDKYKMKIQKK